MDGGVDGWIHICIMDGWIKRYLHDLVLGGRVQEVEAQHVVYAQGL